MLICGIDPGSGKSSPSAVVAFDPETKYIESVKIINGSKDFTEAMLASPNELGDYISVLPEDTKYYIEKFVMRGRGGETLQKFVGAFLHKLYSRSKDVSFVQNTSVKALIGAHGQCSKEDIGIGVLSWFSDNDLSVKIIENILKEATYIHPDEVDKKRKPKSKITQWGKFDILDAFAIAITGYEAKK
jgi:Holliday junction resolvasome RuvABC endonuclease subunit